MLLSRSFLLSKFFLAEDKYLEVNKKYQSFVFWWNPDSSFVQLEPRLLEMPPHQSSEYKAGIFQSQSESWAGSP